MSDTRPTYKGLAYGQNAAANESKALVSQIEAEAPDFIFGRPTDKPDVPLTSGMPFGEGPAYTPLRAESDADYRKRTAQMLLSSPAATSEARRFAQRLLEGD